MTDAEIAAIEQLVSTGDDADEVLRSVVAELVAGGCAWAGILFSEDGELVLGPHAGDLDPSRRTTVPVTYSGEEVAQLVADGCNDRHLLERVAALISSHCLVGWDTGGEPWDPAA